MRDPGREFSTACSAGFVVSMLFYSVVSFVAYFYYGDHIGQSFTQNIGFDLEGAPLHGLKFLSVIACAGFTLKLQGTLPLICAPVLVVVENALGWSAPAEERKPESGSSSSSSSFLPKKRDLSFTLEAWQPLFPCLECVCS